MAYLSAQAPPPMTELHAWVLDSASQLKLLRSSLQQQMRRAELPDGTALDEVPEKVVLVATELATNALRHGLPPTTVRLGRHGDNFILDVADHNTEDVPEFAEGRSLGGGGLGLRMARQFSLEMGWYVNGATKHVWAEFPVVDTLSGSGAA